MYINLPKLGPVKFRDDLTPEEFQGQLQALSTKYGFELPKTDYGYLGSFTKGVSRGMTRMGETLGDVLPAMVGSALGADEYAKQQLGEAAETERQLQEMNPAQFKSFRDVGGVGEGAKFFLENLGELTPDIAGVIASGGIGGAAAKRGAAKYAEKQMAKIAPELLESGATKAELGQVAGRLAGERVARGQGIGAYLGSYSLNAPDVFQGIYQDSGQLAPGASLLFGSVISALDTVLPQRVLQSLSPAAKTKVAESILKQSGMRPGLAKTVGKNVLSAAGTEGLTEGAQEALGILAEKFVNENRELWTSDDFNRIIESSVRGMLGGGPFGAVTGVSEYSRTKAADQAAQQAELDRIQTARDREDAILAQAKAEEAARIDLEQRRAAGDLGTQAELFGEPPAGPIQPPTDLLPVETQTPIETGIPAGQAALFGEKGKPTPEALASVKLGQQQARAAEKAALDLEKQRLASEKRQAKVDEQWQKQREAEQLPQGELFGAPTTQGELFTETTTPDVTAKVAPVNIITDDTVASWGVGKTAKLRKDNILAGKDMTNQEDVDFTHDVLDKYLENKNLSSKIADNVIAFKEALPPKTTEVIKTQEKIQTEKAPKNVAQKATIVAKKATPAPTPTQVPSTGGLFGVLTAGTDITPLDITEEADAGTDSRDVGESLQVSGERAGRPAGGIEEPIGAGVAGAGSRVGELEVGEVGEQAAIEEPPGIDAQGQKVLDDFDNQFFETKGEVKRHAQKLVKQGWLDQKQLDSIDYLFKDKDMGPEDVVAEVRPSLEYNIEQKLAQKEEPTAKKPTAKKPTVKEAAKQLGQEIDKALTKYTKANFTEETPPEVMKALVQLIDALVREGVKTLGEATARVRKEFGENVFRQIKPKDVQKVFNERIKQKPKAEEVVEEARNVASDSFEVLNKLMDTMPEGNQVKEGALNALSNVTPTLRNQALKFFSLQNLIDVYGDKFPTLKNILTAVERRGARNMEYRDEVSRMVNKGFKIMKQYSPEEQTRMYNIALDVTRMRLDPRKAEQDKYPAVKAFNQLPPAVRSYFIELADTYENYSNKYLDLLIKHIPEKAGREYLTAVERMRKDFESRRVPFYLPLLRSGDYWSSFTDTNGERVVLARESLREIEKLAAAAEKAGAKNVSKYTQVSQITHRSVPPSGFMAGVVKELQDAKVNDEVINDIYRAYMDLFPSESLRQQFRPREGYKGYDADLIHGFAKVGSRMAHQLANMEFSPEIGKAINGVKESYLADPTPENQSVYENIQAQEAYLNNPVAETWSSRLSHFSYFTYITGNISSALVNITQLPIVVYSVLGGKYGFGEASNAMFKAVKMYMNGSKDNNSDFMPDWTFGTKAKGEYAELYKQAVDRSALRRGVGYDITEISKSSSKDYTGLRSKSEHALNYMFQNSERFNREVTLIAAFDLARKKGKSVQEAIDEAIQVSNDVHSHALTDAGPRIFQHGIGKVMFTFKRFAQAQIALLVKLFNQAFKGESPEVKAIARKQLLGIYGMAYLFSGMQGMPLYGAAELLASVMTSLFGDDDEPYDMNETVRAAVGDLGYKGPVNQLLNLDIAGRTGFNNMVWRDDPRRLAEVGPALYAIERFMGPAYSALIVNPKRALDQTAKGQYERAIETMMPSFVRNGFKGMRYANEGALNSAGVPIVEDVNGYNAMMQVLGFTPADLSEAYERAGVMRTAQDKIMSRRGGLLDAYYLAKSTGDVDTMMTVREKIDEFNEKHPESGVRITSSTLKRSESARQKAIKDSVDGVRLNSKMKNYLIENYGS